MHHEFVNYDDDVYVFENAHVKDGLTPANITWAFSHTHDATWHPLTTLTHLLDCQLYGVAPGGHHLTSVLIHALTAILLFLVLRSLTSAMWPSAFVAAVFAVHPLHVESVAWVAERKDALSAFFFVLTLGAYTRYARAPSGSRYLVLLLAFACALMSKPMVVTFPFVALLLDYWPLQRFPKAAGQSCSIRWLLLEKAPLFLMSAILCYITLQTQHKMIHAAEVLTLSQRLNNAVVTCTTYLGQFFFPAQLAVFYPFPFDGVPASDVLIALIILAAITIFAIVSRTKHPYILVGWLWYLGMLVPVIGLVQVGSQAHADRYTYLPLIGFTIMLTWTVSSLAASRPNPTPILAGIAGVALAILVVGARVQTSFWHDSETLWTHTLDCTSDRNALAQSNLGNYLFQKGRYDDAIIHCQKALDVWPDDSGANNCLGFVLLQKGQVNDAIAHFNTALQSQPDYAPAHNNLGMALYTTGHYAEAVDHLEKALATEPDLPDAHNNLGAVLVQTGHPDDAIAHYQKALQLKANYAGAENNLAWILATSPKSSVRNGTLAVEHALKADQLAGGNLVILRTLAAAYAEAGQFNQAMDIARQALQLAAQQNNVGFMDKLTTEIKLYQSGQPLRDNVPVN